MKNDLISLRLQLFSKGWHVLPNHGKECRRPGWNTAKFLDEDINPTGIRRWARSHTDLTTGLRIEGGLVVLDADIDDALVDQLYEKIAELAPELIERAPLRYGASWHKFALFARLELDGHPPFARWASARYLRPDEDGKGHQVEVFGGKMTHDGNCSKQVAIYGPHPDGVDYSWAEGPQLTELTLAELPVLTYHTIGQIIDAYEHLAADAGWRKVEPRLLTADHDAVYDLTDAMTFDVQGGDRVTYVGLEAGQRCSSSFIDPKSGGNRSKCHVFATSRYDNSIAVYDYKTMITHYHEKYKPRDLTDLTEGLRKLSREAAPNGVMNGVEVNDSMATSYQRIKPMEITSRQFLYGRRLARQYVSATVAPGGVGKTALEVSEALAMISGKPLLRVKTDPCRVWLWSLEDPRIDMVRRIEAAAKHYHLTDADFGDRLFVDTARERRLVIAKKIKDATEIATPVIEALIQEIRKRKIDVLIIDPFISCHDVPENDNSAIDAVTKAWAEVANLGNCAVELVHHVRKGEKEITTESARGGGAFGDACRMVRVVNRMTEEQGGKLGITNHRLYFRTYIDKNNLAPPAEHSDWFTLVSVDLGNSMDGHASDRIGVVAPWEYPTPAAMFNKDDFNAAAAAIMAGTWRAYASAQRWVGKPIADALGLDLDDPANLARVKALIKYWTKEKLLVEIDRPDVGRKTRTFVEVSPRVRPGT